MLSININADFSIQQQQAGTRDKAIELCLLYVEVEEDQGEGVIVALLPSFSLHA